MEFFSVFFQIVLILFLAKVLYNFLRGIAFRIVFMNKLQKQCSKLEYKIEKKRSFFASFFRFSDTPDIIITTSHEKYMLRFFCCLSKKRFYYFVSSEYYIRSFQIFTLLPMAIKFDSPHFFACRKHMCPFKEDYTKDALTAQTKLVILINPVPSSIYYLNKDNQGQSSVVDGAKVGNWSMYSGKGFLNLLRNDENNE